MAEQGIVVQKFGGTSVSDAMARERVARIVRETCDSGVHPVVVVSAPGRIGDAYATDTLLTLLHSTGGEIPPRESDLLLGCGEIISAVVMAGHLRREGVRAKAVTGPQAGIETDEGFTDAKILRVDPGPLMRLIQAGIVPVVAGFQGMTPTGELSTLGRGGSDTSAAALGAALGAAVVEIFTDVAGVKTADPRIVPDARTIEHLEYDEMFQLAQAGARVVHPRAVELARQAGVPIRVRSSFAVEDEGTLVGATRIADLWQSRRPERAVVGITDRSDVGFVVVRTPEHSGRSEAEARLFRDLGKAQISVDMIGVFPGRVSFIVDSTHLPRTTEVVALCGLPCDVQPEVAKVAIVGSAIAGLPGVMATLTEALLEAGVSILATSDSHSSIACLVPKEARVDAIRALHLRFRLA